MTAITNADTVRTVTMEPAMIRKLANAAKKATDWTQERNRLIKEAHEAGAGYREIGRAVGLSHVGVKGIVEGYTIIHLHGSVSDDDVDLDNLTVFKEPHHGSISEEDDQP